MTPTERADALRYSGVHLKLCPGDCKDIKLIAAQIEEAVREAFKSDEALGKISQTLTEIAYRKGFYTAREKAKGIAEAHRWDRDKVSTVAVIDLITDRIGEMEPDK